jgi:hypothetical protein
MIQTQIGVEVPHVFEVFERIEKYVADNHKEGELRRAYEALYKFACSLGRNSMEEAEAFRTEMDMIRKKIWIHEINGEVTGLFFPPVITKIEEVLFPEKHPKVSGREKSSFLAIKEENLKLLES